MKLKHVVLGAWGIAVILVLIVSVTGYISLRSVQQQFASSAREKTALASKLLSSSLSISDFSEAKKISKCLFGSDVIAGVRVANEQGDIIDQRENADLEGDYLVKKPVLHSSDPNHVVGEIAINYCGYSIKSVFKRQTVLYTATTIAILVVVFAVLLFLFNRILNFLFALKTDIRELLQTEPRLSDQKSFIRDFQETFEALSMVSKELSTLRHAERESACNAAIARTTQMLAHDVRKPFSLMADGLALLASAKSIGEIQELVQITVPSVEKSLLAVNGMLADVMEVGRTAELAREAVSLDSLVESALADAFRLAPKAQITLHYDFCHLWMLDVEPLKVLRVLSNIVNNALQAMKHQGEIWIRTRDIQKDGKPFMEVSVGNSGPAISEEDIPRLFDAFFTKGKKGGTGLGLAIAKKVVTAHGGEISCHQIGHDSRMEFRFSLPERLEPSRTTAKLYGTSQEFTKMYDAALNMKVLGGSEESTQDACEVSLRAKILDYTQQRKRQLNLAILDDEALYRSKVQTLVATMVGMAASVQASVFASPVELLASTKITNWDALVCDIDLGPDLPDGFEVVETLRKQGFAARICMHSNRCLPEDLKRSIKAGADAFFPKPMSHAHLMRFLVSACDTLSPAAAE